MSTISIMPLGTKIRITRTAEVEYSGRLKGFEQLKDAGYIVGKALLLEDGCHVRFDGFKAFAKSKDYPDVKLTVYPIGGKSAPIYVSMEKLDRLSWEPASETRTKTSSISTRKYNVGFTRALNDLFISDLEWVYPRGFSGGYNTVKSDWTMINPLEFTEEERKQGFSQDNIVEIGEALLTEASRLKRAFRIGVKCHYRFETGIHEGMLSARCSHKAYTLIAYRRYFKNQAEEIWAFSGDKLQDQMTETEIASKVKGWMKSLPALP